MNNKKFYSAKDIIIGSRQEYLENEKYLKPLRDLCDSYDKNINDFYFYINKTKDKKTEILCNSIENLKTFRGIILYLMKNYYNEVDIKCINKNGRYTIDSNYSVFIKDGCMEQFSTIASKILDSDFANNIENINAYKKNEYSIYITPSKINIATYDDGYIVYFNYNPRKDCININSNKKIFFDESTIDYFLDLQIPSSVLSDYQKRIINNNLNSLESVKIVSDNEITNNLNLNILETEGNITLNKSKTKKLIK